MFDKMSGMMSGNDLFIIALLLLAMLVVYEVVMTIIISRMKRERKCLCNLVHGNWIRHSVVSLIAWFFAAFALIDLLPIYGGIADVSISVLMLPITFIFLFYLIEMVFGMINKMNCDCQCTMSCSCEQSASSDKEEVKSVTEEKQKGGFFSRISGSKNVAVRTNQEERVAYNSDKNAAMNQQLRPQMPAPAGQPAPQMNQASAQRPTQVVTAQTAADKMEKKNESIEKLGAKIERQRQDAVRQTDTMKTEDIPVYSQSKEAKKTVEDASVKANELQQKGGVGQTSTRDVAVTENVSRNESVVKTEGSIVQETTVIQKSVVELQGEKERLQKQYDVLKGLSESPDKGKFDENEVKSAMDGLDRAIKDLQSKIDSQGGK